MYSNNFERTLELTKEWKNSKFRGIEGSYRARAIKASVENIDEIPERAKGISRAVATLMMFCVIMAILNAHVSKFVIFVMRSLCCF